MGGVIGFLVVVVLLAAIEGVAKDFRK